MISQAASVNDFTELFAQFFPDRRLDEMFVLLVDIVEPLDATLQDRQDQILLRFIAELDERIDDWPENSYNDLPR